MKCPRYVSQCTNLKRKALDMSKHAEPLTISVPAAGKRLAGLSRNSSYAAAARGEIPVIRRCCSYHCDGAMVK
jgi:hypothetical protein